MAMVKIIKTKFYFYKPRSTAGKDRLKNHFYIDSSGGRIYMMMKLQCIMKDSWRIGNFPFDRQS